jgi:hypothetical protein
MPASRGVPEVGFRRHKDRFTGSGQGEGFDGPKQMAVPHGEEARHSSCPRKSAKRVFALDVAGIHVFEGEPDQRRGWPGRSPAMTVDGSLPTTAGISAAPRPQSAVFRFRG